MAKVLTLPIKPEMPDPARRKAKPRKPDPRYVEGQRLLVEAMKYLIQQDPQRNKDAVSLISEHFRTRFRMSDRPVDLPWFSSRITVKPIIFQIRNISLSEIHYSGFTLLVSVRNPLITNDNQRRNASCNTFLQITYVPVRDGPYVVCSQN